MRPRLLKLSFFISSASTQSARFTRRRGRADRAVRMRRPCACGGSLRRRSPEFMCPRIMLIVRISVVRCACPLPRTASDTSGSARCRADTSASPRPAPPAAIALACCPLC